MRKSFKKGARRGSSSFAAGCFRLFPAVTLRCNLASRRLFRLSCNEHVAHPGCNSLGPFACVFSSCARRKKGAGLRPSFSSGVRLKCICHS